MLIYYFYYNLVKSQVPLHFSIEIYRNLTFLSFNRELQIAVETGGPQLQTPNCSRNWRTSTANSRLQSKLVDLNCKLQIAVVTASPHLETPDCSGHCRTSTGNSRLQWPLPGLNCQFQIAVATGGMQLQIPDCSGHCRTPIASPHCNGHSRIGC